MKRIAASLLFAFIGAGISSVAFADAKATFDSKCAACHGKDGKGKTKMGEKMKIKDLTDPAVNAALTDAAIVEDVTNGVKEDGKQVMQGYKGKIPDADVKGMVEVIRGFKGK